MARPGTARTQILDTATRLFYERGISATGVDTVVAESGVSKPTLYAHFRSKDELVEAVLLRRRDQRTTEIPAWVRAHARTPRCRLLAVFDWLEDMYRREGGRGCAFVNAAAEAPDAASPVRIAAQQEKAWFRGYLAGLARDAGLRAPDTLAVRLQLLVEGTHGRAVVEGAGPALREATRQAKAAARELVAAATPRERART